MRCTRRRSDDMIAHEVRGTHVDLNGHILVIGADVDTDGVDTVSLRQKN